MDVCGIEEWSQGGPAGVRARPPAWTRSVHRGCSGAPVQQLWRDQAAGPGTALSAGLTDHAGNGITQLGRRAGRGSAGAEREGRQQRLGETGRGTVTADQVVLASGTPFLDRGLYFAKVTPQRSYVVAFRVPGAVPRGMYLSADTPTRSLRTALHEDQELLLVGGNGHEGGHFPKPASDLADDLINWTKIRFPGAEVTHIWSAQDYQSHNHVPFVGKLPRGGGHVQLATGYGKWGMTNAAMAAMMIADNTV